MRIDEMIKKRRVEMKLTQEKLAEKCNATPQAVSRWKSGEKIVTIFYHLNRYISLSVV